MHFFLSSSTPLNGIIFALIGTSVLFFLPLNFWLYPEKKAKKHRLNEIIKHGKVKLLAGKKGAALEAGTGANATLMLSTYKKRKSIVNRRLQSSRV